jgi:hypothetical protein
MRPGGLTEREKPTMKSADFPLRFSHPLPTGEVKVGGGNTKNISLLLSV